MKQLSNSFKYLAANQSDEEWGLVVTTVGFHTVKAHSIYPPENHPLSYYFKPGTGRVLNEFQFLYITKGNGIFESASCSRQKLSEGMVLLLFPGEWHSYRPSHSSGWDEYWIGFRGNFIDSLILKKFFSKMSPIVNIGFNESIIEIFNHALEVAKSEKAAFQQMLASFVIQLLSITYYTIKNDLFLDHHIVNEINKARMLMRENLDSNINVEEISDTLSMSYSWFRRMFKKYTGFTPAQYMLQLKVQRAKELLTSSDIPIKEISFTLNFETENYFYSFFKKNVGLSPSIYRNRVHGKYIGTNNKPK